MTARLRLVDAAAIAAGALLCLKVLGLAGGSHAVDSTLRAAELRTAADQSGVFAQALSRARTNGPVAEPSVTGATTPPDAPKPDAPAPPAAPAPPRAAAAAGVPESPSERALLERLGERREEWQQKGRDLELREKLLENAERKLEARINELKAIEEKAEAAATARGDTEAGALKNLVTMYETMKPKEAARVFDRLSHDVLVPVVLQMNPRKMAEVLAVMAPEAAERLTVALATRPRGRTASSVRPGLPPNELPAVEPPAKP
jgi:flagellar motility protein MotE (MotC chaperone)